MAKRKSKGPNCHMFSNKLLLNQWLASLYKRVSGEGQADFPLPTFGG